jgi:hypothetical protein
VHHQTLCCHPGGFSLQAVSFFSANSNIIDKGIFVRDSLKRLIFHF